MFFVNFIAKPVDNLALRVFQRFYHELCQALINCPEEVATVLYSNELVTILERSQAVDTQGLAPFRKAEILMQCIERRVVADSSIAFRKFCKALKGHPHIGSIVSRMKLRLGGWIR